MMSNSRLWNRNFTLLWLGQTVSGLGTTAFTIAMLFWVKHETQSPTLMAALLMVAGIPGLLLGPLGGAVADYFSRRSVIITTDVLNGLSMLSLGFIYFLKPEATNLILVWVFIVTFLGGTFGAFFRPAVSAAIPDLVPGDKLTEANLVTQLTVQVVRLVGQALGGMAFNIFGALKIFVFNGISYLLSAFSEAFIVIPKTERERKPQKWCALIRSFGHDIIEGYHYVWRRKGMRNLFVATGAVNFLLAPLGLLLPFYVEDELALDAMWYGFMIGSITLGTMVGFFILKMIPKGSRFRRFFLLCLLPAIGLMFLALARWPFPYIALGLLFSMGCMTGAYNLNNNVVLQVTTPTEIRGRVFGFLSTLVSGITPLSLVLTGYLTQASNKNVLLIFAGGGSCLLVLTLLITCNKDYRDYLTWEP